VSGVVRQEPDGIVIEVQVVPRASRERLGPLVGDRLKVQITAPPVDGEANEALRALLAKRLGVPRSQVQIVRGESSRKKSVRVQGVGRAEIDRILVEEKGR
jgi:uncharacterized protein (TIGR00251 family)